MQLLENRILSDGKALNHDVLKVGCFLNHLIDEVLLDEIGKEIANLFAKHKITKILTIEASGIAIAVATARYANAPVLFAKKAKTSNISDSVYSADVFSFTHNHMNTISVEKDFLLADDKVLIVDDFLAKGEALNGLMSLVSQSGAELVGCAIAIEKGFQGGGDALRAQGIRVESLALIDSMDKGQVVFRR